MCFGGKSSSNPPPSPEPPSFQKVVPDQTNRRPRTRDLIDKSGGGGMTDGGLAGQGAASLSGGMKSGGA